MSIFDASMKYQADNVSLVVLAGKEYGTGSSRDWAAKGTQQLGVKAVIAESFERIHRSNLIGMGVMPMQFEGGANRTSLKLDGSEKITITPKGELAPKMKFDMTVTRADGSSETCQLVSRVDTQDEMSYFKNGGILQYVLRRLKDN